jgi:hypothetical protein
MHFYNLPFPIRDYLNDCALILDSSSRVVMGMIEMAKEKRLLDATQTIIYIQQAIYQGLGCNLPFVEFPVWKEIDKKFNGLAGLVESLAKGEKSREFAEVVAFISKNVKEYDTGKRDKIVSALRSFPRMRMRVKAENFNSEDNAEDNEPIEAGGEAVIKVELSK